MSSPTDFVCAPCRINNKHADCSNFFLGTEKFICQCVVPTETHWFLYLKSRIDELEKRIVELELPS